MFARIGVMRALNRDHIREFDSLRRIRIGAGVSLRGTNDRYPAREYIGKRIGEPPASEAEHKASRAADGSIAAIW
jgi:hypothetical protein